MKKRKIEYVTIVGIYLEAEEILNLILKNGNKVLKVIKNES